MSGIGFSRSTDDIRGDPAAHRPPWLRMLGLLLLLGLMAGCGSQPAILGPTALPVLTPTPLPSAQVSFVAVPPADTPSDAELRLVILDEVTGFDYSSRELPMQRSADGSWRVESVVPVGALLRYRYQRGSPSSRPEQNSFGEPVAARLVYIPASLEVSDQIAAWAGEATAAASGRLTGRILDSSDGAPLPQQIVAMGGMWAFTDGQGEFHIDGLPAGLGHFVVFSPDGAYRPFQQGAIIAADGATPVEVALVPAEMVRVTFEVAVPSDTLPGSSLRIAGNLAQLGHRFSQLPNSLRGSPQLMPNMNQVDDTHFIWITSLPAGSYLRYKYTLGDGLWNAERTPAGYFNLRQVLIPDEELVLRDQVSTWRGEHGSVLIEASAPEDSPGGEVVFVQFNPATQASPLPMLRVGDSHWLTMLYGPQDFQNPLSYRYCRNGLCGPADEAAQAGSAIRQAELQLPGTAIHDTIEGWAWWQGSRSPSSIVAPEIGARPGFEAGVELLAAFQPDWLPWIDREIEGLGERGANALIWSPAWVVRRPNPKPLLEFDPAYAPYWSELTASIELATEKGFSVSLRPTLQWPDSDPSSWWNSAARDSAWWEAWFESYRAFALTHARLAAEAGAARLILGGWEVLPSLPGGTLPNGEASGVPAESLALWRALIEQVRGIYPGRLAFELELGTELQTPPAFIADFDEIHLHWWAPLSAEGDLDPTSLRLAAIAWLNEVLESPELAGLPLVLSVAYPSVEGGAAGCVAGLGDDCLEPSDFDLGRDPAPSLSTDFESQTRAINAVLLACYDRGQVSGFYVRGYQPVAALQDKSTSVNGKPAAEVLWYWYPKLTGRSGSQ